MKLDFSTPRFGPVTKEEAKLQRRRAEYDRRIKAGAEDYIKQHYVPYPASNRIEDIIKTLKDAKEAYRRLPIEGKFHWTESQLASAHYYYGKL